MPTNTKEALWERFKAASSRINKQHQEYFEALKAEQVRNLELKTGLCETTEELAAQPFTTRKEWNRASEKLLEIQKTWKTIGFAPKKDNNRIYERFRAACDRFFEAKRQFYAGLKAEMDHNLQLKNEICEAAESLSGSEEWKKTTDELIALQARWKQIGAVSRRHSEAVWKRFRAACDRFFERKSTHFAGVDSEHEENLRRKLALLDEMAAADVRAGGYEVIKDFQRRWGEIGFVPIKQKEAIQKRYKAAVDALLCRPARNGARPLDEPLPGEGLHAAGYGRPAPAHRARPALQQRCVSWSRRSPCWRTTSASSPSRRTPSARGRGPFEDRPSPRGDGRHDREGEAHRPPAGRVGVGPGAAQGLNKRKTEQYTRQMKLSKPKYIFVTGGVASSLGKGIISASTARLLQARGYSVTIQKLDPYINVDPGTLNPYEHGECYVTEDGAETDLDLGHYERFTNHPTSKANNVTTGRIYKSVIEKERKGEYLGKTVQVIPHITDEIKRRIQLLGQTKKYDIIITEIGGTVGDIESQPFIESVRQLRYSLGYQNTALVHLTLIPYMAASGELKTKPTQQHSVKALLENGLQPDILVLRAERP